MAKAKRGEKSQGVRELLNANPDMPVKDIVSQLAAKGIKIKPNLVYFFRAKGKAKKRKAARQQAVASISSNGTGSTDAIALVRRVRDLSVEAGGMRKLKALVDLLLE